MARRGEQLREHILMSAKDVFLEMIALRKSINGCHRGQGGNVEAISLRLLREQGEAVIWL